MKRTRFLMTMLTVLMSMAAWSADGDTFNFSYSGSTLSYYVISESEKTCMVTGASSITSTGALSIPSTANGYTVTIIGSEAFEGNGIISSVTIPSTVKSIYGQAFKDCSKLVSVTIPGNVESILREAFRRCTNLTTVTMREGVKTLGDGVFKECSALATINFPNTITSLGESVFSGTEWVGNLSEGVTYIGTIAYKYIESSSTTSVTLKDGTTQIFNFAFYNYKGSNITSVSIPNTVTTIGKEAFESCYYLTTINFPTSLTTIGDRAFMSCSSLTSVELPSSATNLGTSIFSSCTGLESATLPSGITAISSSMFNGCTKLSNFTMPESVTSVGDAAFYECESLTSIDLTRLYTIGQMAFERCVGLTSIDIPKARTIGIRAFSGCTGLTEVTIPSTVTTMETWDNCWAFSSCTGLRKITIEDGAKLLGTNTFNGCYYVETVISYCKEPISVYDSFKSFASNATLYVPSGCAEAYKAASYWKDFSKIVEMEDGVDYSSVGNTFAVDGITYKISNVKPLEVQVGLRTGAIDESYEGSLTIPSTVTGTDGKVYTCTSICYGAFSDNYNITSITIPNTVESISNNALNYDLPKLVVNWETPIAVSASIGIGVNQSSCILYVPAGTRDAYAKADYWKDFKEIVELGAPAVGIQFADAKVKALCVANWDTNGDGELSEDEAAAVTDLGDVFQGNKEITSFNELQYFSGLQCNDKDLSGNTYSGIPYFAFMGCTNLKQVTLPNVEAIGHAAFSGSGLTAITIPSSVRIIIDEAFYNTNISDFVLPASVTDLCDSYNVAGIISSPNLKSIVVESGNPVYDSRNNCNAIVRTASNQLINGCATTTIPATVTSIRQYAFMGCQGLTAITIPISVTSIGGFAFEGCNNLTSVTVENPMPFTIGDGAFSNCANATLHVPAGSKAAYKDADGWKEFKEIVEPVVPGSADTPFTCAEAVTFVSGLTTDTPTETEYYVKGKICKIQHNYGYQYGNASFWISDNGTDNGSFYVYRTLYFEKEKYNGGRVPNIGDEVVLCGKMINYQGTTPETYVNQCRLVSLNNKTVGTALEVGELFVAKTPEDVEMFFVVDNTGKSMGMTTVTGCSVGYAVGDRPETYTNAPACIDPSYNGPITIPETVEGLPVQAVAPSAFTGAKLTAVTMPASIWDVETNAFSGCTKLASVKMPENVILNNGTFKNCTSLTSVELPKGVQLWANDVIFEGCTNLTSITVNDEVPYELQGSYVVDDPTSVTLYVPAGCADAYKAADYWKEFNIEEAVRDYYCGDNVLYAYDADTKTLTISGTGAMYDFASASDVPWADYRDNAEYGIEMIVVEDGVTQIGKNAFFNCKNATYLSIPATVTSIGENAFNKCQNLEVHISDLAAWCGMTFANYHANPVTKASSLYVGDAPVTSLVIPETVTDIKDYAFADYTGITSLEVSNSVTTIGKEAFKNNAGLTSVTIGDGVTSIGANAFEKCSSLTKLVLGSKVSSIGASAFACQLALSSNVLTEVYVKNSTPIAIDATCFASNTTNATLYVPAGSKAAYEAADNWKDFNAIMEGGQVVYKAPSGTKFTSGQEVEVENMISLTYGEKGGNAFHVNRSKSIIVDGVKFTDYTEGNGTNGNRDGGTFYVLRPTMNGTITAVVKQSANKGLYVEESGDVMDGFNGLVVNESYYGGYTFNVKANRSYKVYCAGSRMGFYGFIYKWRNDADQININFASNEVKSVLVTAFDTSGDGELSEAEAAAVTNEQFAGLSFAGITADNWTFDELQFFNSVTKIPAAMFKEAKLTSVKLPESVTELGEASFQDTKSLNSFNLANVTKIGNFSFIGSNLESLTVPATVTEVGYESFSWNWTMSSVKFKRGSTKVFDTMFHGNHGLTNVDLPNTITEISDRAFRECVALSSIVLPSSLTKIGEQAFEGCTSLTKVTVNNSTPVAIVENVFSNRANAVLLVPEGSVDAYKAADYWKEFKKILPIGTTYFKVVDGATYTSGQVVEDANIKMTFGEEGGADFATYWPEGYVNNNVNGEKYGGTTYTFEPKKDGILAMDVFCNAWKVLEVQEDGSPLESISGYMIDEAYTGEIGFNVTAGKKYKIYAKGSKLALSSFTFPALAIPEMPANVISVGQTFTYEGVKYVVTSLAEGTVSVMGSEAGSEVRIPKSAAYFNADQSKKRNFSVTGINDDAFADRADLLKVTVNIPTPIAITANTFSNRKNATLYVPEGSVDAYKAADYWKEFKSIVAIGTEVAVTDVSAMANAVYVEPLTGSVGRTFTMDVKLKNETAIKGYSFSLQLPDGVTVEKDDNDNYSYELSGRHDDYVPQMNYDANSKMYNFITLSSLSGNDGTVWTLKLQVDETVALGEYPVTITNAKFTPSEGYETVDVPETVAKLTIIPKTYKKGDANDDDDVDIADLVCIVNHVVGIATPVYIAEAADVTGNGNVDVTDATKVLDYIVGEIAALAPAMDVADFNAPALAPAMAMETGSETKAAAVDISTLVDALYADKITLKPGETVDLAISLKNAQATSGYQFDLVLPEGFTLAKDGSKFACTLSGRHNGHAAKINNSADRTYTVAVYSLASKALTGNDGVVCTFRLEASSEVAYGSHTAAIQNAKYSLTSGASKVTLPRMEIALAVGSGVKGDVNNDGKVTITDAVGVVNYILGNPAKDFNEDAADVNGDGNITITDAVGIVNIILSGSPSAPKLEAPEPEVLYDPE